MVGHENECDVFLEQIVGDDSCEESRSACAGLDANINAQTTDTQTAGVLQ
jgi:hypothetical protein